MPMKRLIDNFSLRVTQDPLGVKQSLGKRGIGGYFNEKCHNFGMVPPKFWWKNKSPSVVIIRLAPRLQWKWGTYQFWFSFLFRRDLPRTLPWIFLVLVLSLSLLQSKIASFHVILTILCNNAISWYFWM